MRRKISSNEATAFFAGYASRGPGARASLRAPWSHGLNAAKIRQFMPATFLAGLDHWNAEAAAALLP